MYVIIARRADFGPLPTERTQGLSVTCGLLNRLRRTVAVSRRRPNIALDTKGGNTFPAARMRMQALH